MSKPDLGMGLGAALLVAVCCGGKLLLVAILASGAAVLTGQAIVIMAAAVLALVAIGLVIWRRRVNQCATGIRVERSNPHTLSEALALTKTAAVHEPVATRRDGKP